MGTLTRLRNRTGRTQAIRERNRLITFLGLRSVVSKLRGNKSLLQILQENYTLTWKHDYVGIRYVRMRIYAYSVVPCDGRCAFMTQNPLTGVDTSGSSALVRGSLTCVSAVSEVVTVETHYVECSNKLLLSDVNTPAMSPWWLNSLQRS